MVFTHNLELMMNDPVTFDEDAAVENDATSQPEEGTEAGVETLALAHIITEVGLPPPKP